MIRELIIAPLIGLFIIGFMIQMTEIAQSTSAKVINFTSDMDNALECALNGRSIFECSPRLGNYSFKEDASEYETLNKEYIEELKNTFENATIIDDNYTLTIIINR